MPASASRTRLLAGRAGSHLPSAGECPTEGDFVRVLQIAADGQAAGEASDADAATQAIGEKVRGCLARHVRVGREHDFLYPVSLDPAQQLVDAQMLRLDAVDRRQRAAEHVVQAAELVGAFERDQVGRMLDDADQRMVAARVEADRADLILGQVAALLAEADALLHVLDRGGERQRLLARDAEEMEREAVRGARADARQPRQLRDEILDGRREHIEILPVLSGRDPARLRRAMMISSAEP